MIEALYDTLAVREIELAAAEEQRDAALERAHESSMRASKMREERDDARRDADAQRALLARERRARDSAAKELVAQIADMDAQIQSLNSKLAGVTREDGLLRIPPDPAGFAAHALRTPSAHRLLGLDPRST